MLAMDKLASQVTEIDALLKAYEHAYLDLDVSPSDYKRYNQAVEFFYIIAARAQDAANIAKAITSSLN